MKTFQEVVKDSETKTWADAEKAIDLLSFSEMEKVVEAMKIVDEYFELNPQEKFYLTLMESRIKYSI